MNPLAKNTIYIKVVFLFLTLLLVFQLFRIQVWESDKWVIRSEVRNILRTTYQATRGGVYFSDGSPLAISELAYSIYGLPPAFKAELTKNNGIKLNDFAQDFEEIVGVKKDTILEAINSDKHYVALARKIRPEVIKQLEEKYPVSTGLWNAEQQFIRTYPNNELAAKIIGFVRPNDDGTELGQYGVEQYFDGILRGTEGVFEGQKDNQNQVIVNRDFENITSKDGINVTLTIDRNIQAYLEQKLMELLNQTMARELTAVIMEVGTGRIIAMANVPTFNPNKYWEGEVIDCNLDFYKTLHKKCNPDKPSEAEEKAKVQEQENKDNLIYPDGYLDQLKKLEEEQKRLEEEKKKLEESLNPEKKDELTAEEKKRLEKFSPVIRGVFRKESLPPSDVYRNAASSALYEPGSVIKVMTLATAYNFNTIPDDPNYQLGSHKGCEQVLDVVLCTSSKKATSSLSVEEMLQKSDNIGAFRIAQTMPAVDFAQTFQRFGLGQKSDIELADEPNFTMKSPEEWSKVDLSTGAFGQGSVAFTPIQLTAAWNALASNGEFYKPTIVKEINDNGQIKDFKPQKLRQTVTAEAAKKALDVNAVATSKSSTRAKNFYSKYPFSGKTATASIPKTDGVGYREDAVNMGYIGVAPLENPKFTMLLWMNEPKLGLNNNNADSISAAQWGWIDIADDLMIKMNIPPKN